MHTLSSDPSTVDGARDAVDWYFGDLVDSVARESPVSRAALTDALAELQLAGTRRRALIESRAVTRDEPVQGPEVVFALPDDVWRTLGDDGELSAPERQTARELHRQMSTALGATVAEEAAPLVVLDG